MKRRDFLNIGVGATLGGTIISPSFSMAHSLKPQYKNIGKAKNIIFLVSDGMSSGTLNMADLLLRRKTGVGSNWMNLYRDRKICRALMDTASADSLVTDSAAASSAWGGGIRVNNGSLNVNADGTYNKPIMQKFQDAGKSVGCVTTVPITHATPAGFLVNSGTRDNQESIAALYLDHHFDFLMGGGTEYFAPEKRKDKRNLFDEYKARGYSVVQSKLEMKLLKLGNPVLGVFSYDALPYTLDQHSETTLVESIPTLAEMTKTVIEHLCRNPDGFVLQVEGGKVDWSAHANDIGALLYDQIAFDEAIAIAVDFAEKRDDTLIIITTDHGNSNPGLIKSSNVNNDFDRIQSFKHTNEWILRGISKTDSPSKVIERINYAQGYALSVEQTSEILTHYADLENDGIYNAYKLPFHQLAQIQQTFTSVGWAGMNHSADFVEVTMLGPGSELLTPMILNTELHNIMLISAGITVPS